jgi:hypothetical protein
MAIVTTRQGLIDYCLRRLGFPVTQINLDIDQIEDRVDDALQMFADYHFDATEIEYYAHQLTTTDIANKWIPVPDSLIFITRVMESDTIFSLNHPMGDPKLSWDTHIMNPLGSTSHASVSSTNDHSGTTGGFQLTDYFMTMQNVSLLKELLGGIDMPIRFNRHTNKLYLDMNWERDFSENNYLIVEGKAIIDPEQYSDVYNDRWVKRYLTALLKQQYGTNLSKFSGVALPGGIMLDGDKIYDQASQEIEKLEEELQEKYELPPMPLIG